SGTPAGPEHRSQNRRPRPSMGQHPVAPRQTTGHGHAQPENKVQSSLIQEPGSPACLTFSLLVMETKSKEGSFSVKGHYRTKLGIARDRRHRASSHFSDYQLAAGNYHHPSERHSERL